LGLLIKSAPLSDAEILGVDSPSPARRPAMPSAASPLFNPLFPLSTRSAFQALRGEQLTRLAALLTFRDPVPEECSQIMTLSNREWKNLMRWLDISGLALYFLNRLVELGLGDLLPPAISQRLHLSLIDNTERTRGMISESIAIQEEFQSESVGYAILKGLSLWPNSVPEPELRVQFDLDFLVDEVSAPRARRILERRGYRLYAIGGRSWEFKLNERPGFSLKDIYKDLRSYAVELHIESRASSSPSPLERLHWRELRGMRMPVLAPVDLLLGQGLHVFKHICGESSRASHMLEFRRHVLARRNDNEFWNELQKTAGKNPRASIGLGVVTLLTTRVMGDFAPAALTHWTVENLSQPFRLWVELYGHRAVLDGYPGSKLYLLLQGELETAGMPRKRPLRKALLPFCLPLPVIRARPNESLPVTIRRHFMQCQLILVRLRFHFVEGFRYILEARRWRRMKELAQ
jgi:hypothetical protein